MKWNRDENSWTELKGRAKRQLHETEGNSADMTDHYDMHDGANHTSNKHQANAHMVNNHCLQIDRAGSHGIDEDYLHSPEITNMHGLENEK